MNVKKDRMNSIQDFKQVHISSSIRQYFGEGFKQLWGLEEYSDPNKPAVFFGMGAEQDLEILKAHNSYSIIVWAGGEFETPLIREVSIIPKTIQIGYGWISKKLKELQIKHTEIYLPVKDYSRFEPTPLGDKIYVYRGIHGNREGYFKWNSIIKPLIKHYGENNIIFTEKQPLKTLIEDYYNNCFVYVKPNERGGSTAMWELGLMGRRVIANNQGRAPHVLNYNSLQDIIDLIDKEADRIGTIQKDLSQSVRETLIFSKDWLNLSYYGK